MNIVRDNISSLLHVCCELKFPQRCSPPMRRYAFATVRFKAFIRCSRALR